MCVNFSQSENPPAKKQKIVKTQKSCKETQKKLIFHMKNKKKQKNMVVFPSDPGGGDTRSMGMRKSITPVIETHTQHNILMSYYHNHQKKDHCSRKKP